MAIEVTSNVRRDEAGRLTAVSVGWGENIPWLEQVCAASFGWCLVAFLPIALFSGNLSVLTFCVGIGAFFLARYYPLKERRVTFTSEGKIITPFGYFQRDFDGEIGGNHAHITSIESRKMRGENNYYEVIITSEYGALIRLSGTMPEQTAFQVAVMLSRKLVELRADQADGQSGTVLRGRQDARGTGGEPRAHFS
jgi:hypothetical protein